LMLMSLVEHFIGEERHVWKRSSINS